MVLKYVAFEKRLKEGGKKRGRERNQECKVRKTGGLTPPLPLLPVKRCQLDDETEHDGGV